MILFSFLLSSSNLSIPLLLLLSLTRNLQTNSFFVNGLIAFNPNKFIRNRNHILSRTSIQPHVSKKGYHVAKQAIRLDSKKRNDNNTGTENITISRDLQLKIRTAMTLSAQSSHNITAAYQAANVLWPSIVSSSTSIQPLVSSKFLPPKIALLCNALYASTLTRIGKDEDAVIIYNAGLKSSSFPSTNNSELNQTIREMRLGYGRALQRLMRYGEARDQFLALFVDYRSSTGTSNSMNKAHAGAVDALCSAALCSLRLGDVDAANVILLQKFSDDNKNRMEVKDGNIAGMLGTVNMMLQQKHIYIENELLNTNQNGHRQMVQAMELLKYAAAAANCSAHNTASSFLYQWIYAVATAATPAFVSSKSSVPSFLFPKKLNNNEDKNSWFLRVASINQSPFDEAALICLDDKILLHELLSSSGEKLQKQERNDNDEPKDYVKDNAIGQSCWPVGFVLPRDRESFLEYCCDNNQKQCNRNDASSGATASSRKEWILKDRAGYGSHGNQIVSKEEALEIIESMTMNNCNNYHKFDTSNYIDTCNNSDRNRIDSKDHNKSMNKKSILCQRLVEPPLLINGKKFSLRVYVLYFPECIVDTASNNNCGSVYVSSVGLVKLASATYNIRENEVNGRDAHMTNSGRDKDMMQYDFEFLKEELGKDRYKKIWDLIEKAVTEVMEQYTLKRESLWFDSGFLTSNTSMTVDSRGEQGMQRKTKFLCKPLQSPSIISSIPKIMGLDFIIDSFDQPWLMEVNRFPGLEPRGDSDSRVKWRVVQDAWRIAAERAEVEHGLSPSLLDIGEHGLPCFEILNF